MCLKSKLAAAAAVPMNMYFVHTPVPLPDWGIYIYECTTKITGISGEAKGKVYPPCDIEQCVTAPVRHA